jgi:hypothetical protein
MKIGLRIARAIFFGVLFLVLLGRLASVAQTKALDEEAIRESALRYQIGAWELRADVYFVEVNSGAWPVVPNHLGFKMASGLSLISMCQ